MQKVFTTTIQYNTWADESHRDLALLIVRDMDFTTVCGRNGVVMNGPRELF